MTNKVEKVYDEDGFRVIELTSGFKLRPYQKEVYSDKTRFKTIVFPRRAGKTTFLVNDIVERALACTDPLAIFIYGFPYRQQAKEVVWPMFKAALQYLNDFRDGLVQYNENELMIKLPNDVRIYVKGLDKPDAIRGGKVKHFTGDEWQNCDPYAFDGVISPALSDSQGTATFCGTPRGKNDLYKKFKKGQDPEEKYWSSYIYTSLDINHLPAGELDVQRALLAGTPGLFDQEYMCSFDVAGVGAYYADYLTELKGQGSIGDFPYNDKHPVITAWDLGVNDDTVIWFAQQIDRFIYIIDCYKTNNITDFNHFLGVLDAKGYKYSAHILPFDAKQRKLGATKTVYEIMSTQYPGKIRQANKKLGILEGIQTVKALLPMCKFNEVTTEPGRDALFQYRSEFNEKLGVQDRMPIHDWTSHYADAFRYLATGLKKSDKKAPELGSVGYYNPLNKKQIIKLTQYSPFKTR